jgi:hypothetical protein
MSQFSGSPRAAVDYNCTVIGALELSEKKWILTVYLPGVSRHLRHELDACGDGLVCFAERARCNHRRPGEECNDFGGCATTS